MTTVQLIALIAQTFGVLSACWAIIAGIDAWKREFIGKRQIELAEEALSTFFELKDAMAMIRNPLSYDGEGKSRKKSEDEKADEAKLLDRGYIVFERYETKKEIFNKFFKLKYRFMAFFGSDTEDIFQLTIKTRDKVFIAARRLAIHYWPRQGGQMSDKEFEKHLNKMQKYEGIFWDTYDSGDEIRNDLHEIQVKLEQATKPVFEQKAKSYEFMTNSIFRRSINKERDK
ncbi:MAG: hypothetical protein AAF267_23150 [Deinococcota bacterium]